jgi:hypothetical protein
MDGLSQGCAVRTYQWGLGALLISLSISCASKPECSNASLVSAGMTIGEVKAAIGAANGEYHEFAYHYPGEGDYLRFFSLSSGQVVVARVRSSGKDPSDKDIVGSFWLPPKTFSYSKLEFIPILEKKQYAVLEGLEVGTRP